MFIVNPPNRYAYINAQMQLTSQVMLENEDNGMVVFRAEGLLNGHSFSNELVIVFEFEEEFIRSFHEYVGMPLKNYEKASKGL